MVGDCGEYRFVGCGDCRPDIVDFYVHAVVGVSHTSVARTRTGGVIGDTDCYFSANRRDVLVVSDWIKG